MSFYTTIKTEITNKKYIIAALEEMKRRGEITNFQLHERKEKIEVDRSGDIINIAREKTSNFGVAGDARVVKSFSDRLKQFYAYESIKDNLPLDFEIAKESEVGGDIMILLKS
ncbi:MAG: hypothetical protein HZB80_03145 [Deltaproteobacteria bacterium]|nr:hypothetical protein [Deltaproteobacteria bacterium]